MKCGEDSFSSSLRRPISTFTMVSCLEHTFIIASIFLLNIELCICTCARAEYEINGECCPMCSAGSRVYRHCTEVTSTTCIQCIDSTYTAEPNGLSSCIACTVCDAGQGLRVKMACMRTSDTVCEPLEGFYCTDEYRNSCRYAFEHTKCNPGQYIKQKGTAVKDAECAVCADGTYSNGSLQICKQHTKCEDSGLIEIKPGTNSLDVECGKASPVALIVGILAAVIGILLAGALIAFVIRRMKGPPKVSKSAATAETTRLSHNQPHENLPSPGHSPRMVVCALNHTGHVASPVDDDGGKQLPDPQEHEFIHTGYGVT